MLGCSYALSPRVRIGAGFHWTVLDTELLVTGCGFSGLLGVHEDRDLDIPMTLHAVDLFISSGDVGVR